MGNDNQGWGSKTPLLVLSRQRDATVRRIVERLRDKGSGKEPLIDALILQRVEIAQSVPLNSVDALVTLTQAFHMTEILLSPEGESFDDEARRYCVGEIQDVLRGILAFIEVVSGQSAADLGLGPDPVQMQ
jgi:hypothetical protein